MGEKNGDAKTFWMELEGHGKIDFIFEQVQSVLQSLKQKIKDGSATSKEYIQAMILVNEATISGNSMLMKDRVSVIQNVQENRSSLSPSTSHKDCLPEDSAFRFTNNEERLPLEKQVAGVRAKETSLNSSSYQSHRCSGACLTKTPPAFKGENPLQLPIRCRFQRQHAKTNSHSSALHVSYKTPCGRSLRNMEEVFRYLLETECNFLFTDHFSFNTYVQLTRNYPRQEGIVSEPDISHGVESVPVSFCNEIDSRKLPQFKYRKTVWPRAYALSRWPGMFTDSCDCSEGCIDVTKCACLQLTARNAETCPLSSSRLTTGYKYKRLPTHIPTGIYECSLLCTCNRRLCQNRVVQHGPQVRLQVFKTQKKGWGVRCLDDVDRGTFICIYSGRLLSRSHTGKPTAIGGNRKEETVARDSLSKKRKIEVSECEVEVIPLASETPPASAKAAARPPEFTKGPQEAVIEMKSDSVSRLPYHSASSSPKANKGLIRRNGEKMKAKSSPLSPPKGCSSSDSVASEDSDGFIPTQAFLSSKAKEMKRDTSFEEADSEVSLVTEPDVIDITQSREETPPRAPRQSQTLDGQSVTKQPDGPVEKPPEEESPRRAARGEELRGEARNPPPQSAESAQEFLLDATREGNVGRFLNHSCCPNLWVQNVFVETHDRNFPLTAFFTNRHVKARTELTWDYGYEAGTMPEKEILCQCGFTKCRKKIL